MGRRQFTPDNPPLAGKSKRLWDWFTSTRLLCTFPSGGVILDKPAGEAPEGLSVIQPGPQQRAGGAAEFEIRWRGVAFYCHDFGATMRSTGAVTQMPRLENCFYI